MYFYVSFPYHLVTFVYQPKAIRYNGAIKELHFVNEGNNYLQRMVIYLFRVC